jgi:hypothetical protein
MNNIYNVFVMLPLFIGFLIYSAVMTTVDECDHWNNCHIMATLTMSIICGVGSIIVYFYTFKKNGKLNFYGKIQKALLLGHFILWSLAGIIIAIKTYWR